MTTTTYDPKEIPQLKWAGLAGLFLLPLCWWLLILYVISPLLLPWTTTPEGEVNGYVLNLTILAGSLFSVGMQCAHMQQLGYPGGLGGIQGLAHQFYMGAVEASGTGLVEDAYQIDDGIAVGKMHRQGLGVEDIAAIEANAWQHLHLPVTMGMAAEDTTFDTPGSEAGSKMAADKTGSSQDADPVNLHC